jgi:heme-degrading monooxygenase HmoA
MTVMIVRTWSATATSAGAQQYSRYFASTLTPELRKLPGFAGAYLLSRDLDGTVELTTHTFWDSLASIHAFAGEDIASSVVEPEAQSALLNFDRTATHRSVLVDGRPCIPG